MSKQDKPLPRPPKTPFGRKRPEEGPQDPLMADELAMAAASGDLDDYMKKNLPDNEHARRLAMMMMGMTGMMPGTPQVLTGTGEEKREAGGDREEARDNTGQVPEDVREAVMSGDLTKLKDLLIREHQKRSGTPTDSSQAEPAASPAAAISGMEKEVLDQLLEIASSNSVTLDWLIMRALRVYIQDYRKTGRL